MLAIMHCYAWSASASQPKVRLTWVYVDIRRMFAGKLKGVVQAMNHRKLRSYLNYNAGIARQSLPTR